MASVFADLPRCLVPKPFYHHILVKVLLVPVHSLHEFFARLNITSQWERLSQRFQPKIVQDMMRHGDINLTAGIYTHLQDSDKAAASRSS
jgi:integrase